MALDPLLVVGRMTGFKVRMLRFPIPGVGNLVKGSCYSMTNLSSRYSISGAEPTH